MVYLIYLPRDLFFTWSNKYIQDPTARKLDRLLVNDQWLLMTLSAYAAFGNLELSDHVQCVIHLIPPKEFHRKAFQILQLLGSTHRNSASCGTVMAVSCDPRSSDVLSAIVREQELLWKLETLERSEESFFCQKVSYTLAKQRG